MFLFFSALACLLALSFVLVPLLRAAPEARGLKRRLDALDALRDDLPAEEWQRRHDALEAERAAAPRSNDHRLTAALVVVLVPVLVVLLYRVAGTPEAMDPPDPRAVEVREALGELSAAVNENPEDVESWARLGLIWKNLRQWPAAEAAWRRVLFLDENDAFARVELAETLLFASGRPEMPAESTALLREAVALDPSNQKALWLSGMSAFQQGDFGNALADWQRLDALLPPGDVKEQVNQQMARARAALASDAHASGGVPMAAAPAPEPAPNAATPPADDGGVELVVSIELAPELAGAVSGDETVFVFARASNGPPMPLAVQRFRADRLPATVTLTDADAMAPNMNLSSFDTWSVTARISASGNASASPGDLQGVRAPVTVDDGAVAVRINERVE